MISQGVFQVGETGTQLRIPSKSIEKSPEVSRQRVTIISAAQVLDPPAPSARFSATLVNSRFTLSYPSFFSFRSTIIINICSFTLRMFMSEIFAFPVADRTLELHRAPFHNTPRVRDHPPSERDSWTIDCRSARFKANFFWMGAPCVAYSNSRFQYGKMLPTNRPATQNVRDDQVAVNWRRNKRRKEDSGCSKHVQSGI